MKTKTQKKVEELDKKIDEIARKLGLGNYYFDITSFHLHSFGRSLFPKKEDEFFSKEGKVDNLAKKIDLLEKKMSAVLEHLGQEYYERQIKEMNGETHERVERGLQKPPKRKKKDKPADDDDDYDDYDD